MNKDFANTTLIFKNIPKKIEDVTTFLHINKIPAKEVKPYGRRRVLITYDVISDADHALHTLREMEFSGRKLDISFFCKDKSNNTKKENIKPIVKQLSKGVQATDRFTQTNILTQQKIFGYVQKLYATEGDLGFNQPPPPYLKYNYPPISRSILDNICMALLNNKRFYTQVLHLMNRMNLEPPFGTRQYVFTPPGIPQETATQTDEIITQCSQVLLEQTNKVEEEIETELESSEDEAKRSRPQPTLKRKLSPKPEQYKKKVKQILETTRKLSKQPLKRSATSNLSIKEIFETPEHVPVAIPKIDLQVKRCEKPSNNKQMLKTNIKLPQNFNDQKLALAELESLPIYKNYQKGSANNKLYIRNLHKDVTIADLKLIYESFMKDNDNIKLDIKVMQYGRMKGQAFVTFLGGEKKCAQQIIDKALEDTNGFILLDKPMVVCYGKQSEKL